MQVLLSSSLLQPSTKHKQPNQTIATMNRFIGNRPPIGDDDDHRNEMSLSRVPCLESSDTWRPSSGAVVFASPAMDILERKRTRVVNKYYEAEGEEITLMEKEQRFETELDAIPEALQEMEEQIEADCSEATSVRDEKAAALDRERDEKVAALDRERDEKKAALNRELEKIHRKKESDLDCFKEKQSERGTMLARGLSDVRLQIDNVRSEKADFANDVEQVEKKMDAEQSRIRHAQMAKSETVSTVSIGGRQEVISSAFCTSAVLKASPGYRKIGTVDLQDLLRLHTLGDISKMKYSALINVLNDLSKNEYGCNDEFIRRGLHFIAQNNMLWRLVEGPGDSPKLVVNDGKISRFEAVLKIALYIGAKFDVKINSIGRIVGYPEPDDEEEQAMLNCIPEEVRTKLYAAEEDKNKAASTGSTVSKKATIIGAAATVSKKKKSAIPVDSTSTSAGLKKPASVFASPHLKSPSKKRRLIEEEEDDDNDGYGCRFATPTPNNKRRRRANSFG